MSSPYDAMVLLVHGSRDPAWMEPFKNLRDEVAQASGDARVALACLSFCRPDLGECLESLASSGASRVLVVPVFISALGHVLKDVPEAVRKTRESFPSITIEVSPALGESSEVREAFKEALVRLRLGP